MPLGAPVDQRPAGEAGGATLRRVLIVALVWLFGFAVPGVVHAQEAAIEGAVTDTTGFVLPGVAVEARSVETGGPAAVAFTDGAGLFSISGRVPGTYNVTFTLPGFQTNGRRGVAVGAGATVTLQVELAVQLEERVVVVGSRARPRSVTQSPVPIDAIPFRDVVSQGATSLDYQLRTLVPSFNVATHPISGAASLVRPASLRNRAHDHQWQAPAPVGDPRLVRWRNGRHAGSGYLDHSGDRTTPGGGAA